MTDAWHGEALSICFAAGFVDRAATRRTQPEVLASDLAGPLARVLPIWRGRPLIAGAERDALGWLPPDHGVLDHAGAERVFLGLMPGADGPWPAFGADISAWQPGEVDPTALASNFDASEQAHPEAPSQHRFCELRAVMTRLAPVEAEVAATARGLMQWHDSHKFCSRCGARSDSHEAGWQRRCPQCGGHHFPRTDPVVIMLITRGNQLLMGRSHGWPEGMYSLPAGFMEPGETIEAAVRREVAEETAIQVGAVRYIAAQPWPFPASLMIGCAGEALSDQITVDPHELDDARWVAREEVLQAAAGLHPVMRPARRGAIAHSLIEAWLQGRI